MRHNRLIDFGVIAAFHVIADTAALCHFNTLVDEVIGAELVTCTLGVGVSFPGPIPDSF